MADNGSDDGGEEWEKMRLARRLQELYHGRFTQQDAISLLNHHNWDIGVTVEFTLTARPGELRDVLGENDWQLVEAATRNETLKNNARNKRIPPEFRQFACEKCDHMWWAKVPVRKMVSRCRVCKVKMDALPRDREWGWAVFECQCSNEFRGFGAMGKTQCLCYGCRIHHCLPVRIEPPLKHTRRRSRYRHSCTAPNCFNRGQPGPYVPMVNLCVHPKSLTRQVVEPSTPHVSTGSTVKSFLTQDELMPPYSPYEPSLVDIDEIP